VPFFPPVPCGPVEVPDGLVNGVCKLELSLAGVGVEVVSNVLPAYVRPVYASVEVFAIEFYYIGVFFMTIVP
jgi:hypothetical protein